MIRPAASGLAALALLALTPPAHAAPVLWDFEATSCTVVYGASFGGCSTTQQYPAPLATLTLNGPDSSGTAVWEPEDPFAPRLPVYTGDGFAFAFAGLPTIDPAFTGPSYGECIGPHDICDFDMSWTETAGQLTAVNINVDGFTNSGDFQLTHALIGSDDNFPGFGCVASGCEVTGYWTDAVPEPASWPVMNSSWSSIRAKSVLT
jgi:hypothetical protein